jgi:quercetin dioxygenase-like cupin family protein
MIVKSKDVKFREFLGVKFELLAIGNKSMVTKMLYKMKDKVPYHSHLHEQSGYVISGEYRLRFAEYDEILVKGDSYSIPGNVEHTLEIIKEGEVIDFFNPPREDYL